MKRNKIYKITLIVLMVLFCSTACTSNKTTIVKERLPVDNKKYYDIEDEIELGAKYYASGSLTESTTQKYDLDFLIDNGFVSQNLFKNESCSGYVLVKKSQREICAKAYINCENYITEAYGTSELSESCGDSLSSNGELKNYVGKNYTDAKDELEQLGYSVLVEVNDKGFKKEDIVVSQRENEDGSIVLTISKVLSVYPDFTNGEYTLEDLYNFAETYEINLTVSYEPNSAFKRGAIIEQNRSAGNTIISGTTLKITVAE